jgi:methylglutamate dehydrogenase subunit C
MDSMALIEHDAAPHRLRDGGLIDRGRGVAFRYNSVSLAGYKGDTLASALLAHGFRSIGRSFKYHRPRGILSAGSDEPNGLVTLGHGAFQTPNTKCTTVELIEGLEAQSQNCWPSQGFDLLSLNSLLSPLLVAGFYYKTFMWPASFWERVYEPLIRRAAGLGKASGLPDGDRYDHANAFCDLLVVGSGPAALAAALVAGRSGARVMLCEEDFALGGRLLSERCEVAGLPGHVWVAGAAAEMRAMPNVVLKPQTAVFSVFDTGVHGAIETMPERDRASGGARQRLWRVVSKRTILASGALERGLVFENNDRPGVILASALRSYLNRYAVAPGSSFAVVTNNDDGWRTAYDLLRLGRQLAAVVDTRDEVSDVVCAGVPGDVRVVLGGHVERALGRSELRGIEVNGPSGIERISCDVLAMSGGWSPNLGLTCHLGARPLWDEGRTMFVPDQRPDGMGIAGAVTGNLSLSNALTSGQRAAATACEQLGFSVAAAEPLHADDESSDCSAFWHVGGNAAKAFVDFQNDVTARDIALSAIEGFTSIEHLKRYTTLGMATDQGKTSNVNGLALLGRFTSRPIGQVGTTTFRPPYVPVAIGAFAGPHRSKEFRPTRKTPSHQFSEERGAIFVEAGQWLRAQYYPLPSDRDWLTAVSREVTTVREKVGFCDVSTLGKIEIQGSDAGEFLDRLYINMFSTLPVGRARYGIMLREDGFCLDDGTTSRLAENRYLMTTTTANAARVFQHMHFCHQVLWPNLDVQFVSATESWAQFSVAGPRARDTLRPLVDAPFAIENEAFPYMAVADLSVCGGVPARLYRLSFSGELAYEVAVPTAYGDALARVLMAAGAPFGICPYGTEALGVMRIEKGHVAGNELDGRTTAHDLGLGRMMSTKKDFIGRVLSKRPGLRDPSRPSLVGLRPINTSARFRAGAHLTPRGVPAVAENDQGVVTSVAFSPSLGHWIGLGLLTQGAWRRGERICAADPLRRSSVEVEVCSPVFIDPEGAKLRA